MTDGSRRLAGAACFLAAIWIIVYWLWQPGPPPISYDRSRPDTDHTPIAPQPVAPRVSVPTVAPQGGTIVDPLVRADRPPASSPAPSQAEPPRFREYTIRDRDTFEGIARRELGSPAHAEAIARANPLKDPRRLREGDVIRLPLDPTNIQGTSPAPSPEPAAEARTAAATSEVTYTVASGDSLSKISQLFYGTSRHVDLIFEANRDRLRSVHDVRAGQVIRIPARPE